MLFFIYVCISEIEQLRMKAYEKFILYQNKFIRPYLDLSLKIIDILSFLVSIIFMIAVVMSYGYDMTLEQKETVTLVYRITWWFFIVDIILHLILNYQSTRQRYNTITWILSGLLFLTLVPIIFKQPAHEGSGVLLFWNITNSILYKTSVLFIISFLNVSNGIIAVLGKKTNPALILAISFVIIIIIGSGLLMLPNCTVSGISWIDSLFVATSAVCVTGLSPIDIASTFTSGGLTIIIILIQIGGLGIMTFTSFFAIFFMGNTSFSNHVVLKDIINSNSLNSLLSTLGYILLFTIVIEGIGAFMIWSTIHDTLNMTLDDEIAFSIFHSISAFCNAGFSSMPDGLGNPLLIRQTPLFVHLSLLIILGGIGFPILVNLKNVLKTRIMKYYALIKDRKPPHLYRLYDLNTRIVFAATLVLLIGGTLCVVIFEWNGVLAGLPFMERIVKAFFLAVCPRSAGFNFYDLNTFRFQTLVLYIFLMWIGGASQSTAGGVKVNSVAIVYLNIIAMLKRSDKIEVFQREISISSVQRAHATVFISIFALGIIFFLLTILEPDISPKELALESIAALSTCGAGLGVTPALGPLSKGVLMIAMLLGRVGILTIMLGFIKRKPQKNYKYPNGEIIIN